MSGTGITQTKTTFQALRCDYPCLRGDAGVNKPAVLSVMWKHSTESDSSRPYHGSLCECVLWRLHNAEITEGHIPQNVSLSLAVHEYIWDFNSKSLEMISNFSWDLINIQKDIHYLEVTGNEKVFLLIPMTLQMTICAKITSVFGWNC